MRKLGLFVDAGAFDVGVDVVVEVEVGFLLRFNNLAMLSVGVSERRRPVPLASLSFGRSDRVRGDKACGSGVGG